ncbi:MAG: ATP12 family protein [Pseudomonadota bacterium]
MTDWAAKRFWTDVIVTELDTNYAILLDDRPVKTPAKASLAVPTAALANAIADEWRAQQDVIDPLSMPLTRSANSAIDKVRTQRVEVAQMVADYGGSDLLCYRAVGPAPLVARQAQAWDPLLNWAQTELNVRLTSVHGVVHVAQTTESTDRLTNIVMQQGPFSLTALYDLTALAGSLIIGLAAQRHAFEISSLWAASITDETYQFDIWGDDEDASKLLKTKAASFESGGLDITHHPLLIKTIFLFRSPLN